MKRYSVGAEFWVYAEDEDDARTIVGNFVDGFPDHAGDGADALVQGASEDPE